MELTGKTILVTGAGGFIGSHLAEALAESGAQVLAFLRYNSKNDIGFIKEIPMEKRENIKVFHGDVREPESIELAIKGAQIVFNLAAHVGVPYSYIHPRQVLETNTLGALNILTAAKNQGVEKLIQLSTSEVYGAAEYLPVDEKHPTRSLSPYSASKIGAESIALSFYHSFGMPVTVVRPFNIYGPRQSTRAVIPTIITQALTRNKIHLGSLDSTRDFSFVRDTVDCLLKIATAKDGAGEIFNVGSGVETSIKELVDTVVKILDRDIETTVDEERLRPEKSQISRLCCDNSKVRKATGWAPKVTLEDGLRQSIEYISGRIDQYDPNQYTI